MGDRYYVYAWRGGPCIHTQDDKYPVITQDILAKQQDVKANRYGESEDSFESIITSYRNSPEFADLGELTRRDYNRWLDRASARWGNVPLFLFENREIRGDIVEWRNSYAATPRTADFSTLIMNILLGHGMELGRLNVNVAAKIKKLHKVNKAKDIWEARHWEQWNQPGIPAHLNEAVFLALWTGMRMADLVRVTWEEVGTDAIIIMPRKGVKRNSRAVIPILPELREWLNRTPTNKRTGTILLNSRQESWTTSGLSSVFQKKRPEGFDRTFHDLRGTFCTKLILKGLNDEECRSIMGWSTKHIYEIRQRYVDEGRVVLNLAKRLAA